MITPVDDYISAELKEDLFPGFVDQCGYEGQADGAADVRPDQNGFTTTPICLSRRVTASRPRHGTSFLKWARIWSARVCANILSHGREASRGYGMRLVCMPHRFRRLHADDNGNWVFNNENGVAGLEAHGGLYPEWQRRSRFHQLYRPRGSEPLHGRRYSLCSELGLCLCFLANDRRIHQLPVMLASA